MINPIMSESGELPLLCDEEKCISVDAFVGDDEWKLDYLEYAEPDDDLKYDNAGLASLDQIYERWLDGLTDQQLKTITLTNSLKGVPIPKEWIVVWRHILKYPKLRDSERAARNGMGLNSFAFYWCIWAEQCIKKYASPMEQEIIQMNDDGFLREEIGFKMLAKYGDEFWKPRKKNTTTTPVQVVNNYFYLKMPTDIAKGELLDIAKFEYQKRLQRKIK